MAFPKFSAGLGGGSLSRLTFLAACLWAAAGTPAVSIAATTSFPPGTKPCFTPAIPNGYGSLLIVKSAHFLQSGTDATTEIPQPAPSLTAEIQSPSAYLISNAIVANTRGFSLNLPFQPGGTSGASTNYPTEAALQAATPGGAWNASFQLVFPNGDSFVGFSVFTVASNTPPVPRLANYTAAQAVDPAAPFAIQWTPWVGSGTNDRISVLITDPTGKALVHAATDCSGSTVLPPGATEFSVPAGVLAAGTEYSGTLTFATAQTADQDDGALLVQRVYQSRSTRFTLKTTGSGSGGTPGDLTNPTVSGTNLTFTLSGTAGTIFSVQGSSDLATWTEESRVTIPASGSTTVSVPLPSSGTPRFYRAISVGGGNPGGTGATLSISATSATRMRLTVSGAPLSTHIVQSSTNFTTWVDIGTITVPENATNVAFTIAVPAGSLSAVYRARAEGDVPPPPTGKRPTLTASASANGLLLAITGGDPNRTYVVQQANAALSAWTATTFTIASGANGAGQTVVSPLLPDASAVFRVEAR